MSTIEIIIGSMFSGKTTELLRRCKTYLAIDKKIMLINHSLDSRCSNEIKSHDNVRMNAVKTEYLTNLEISKDIDVIAIDESQFFADLYNFVLIHERKNIVILIAGLDGDSNRDIFGEIYKCIPLSNNVTKLSAMCSICKDGTLGVFSKRLCNNKETICIGSDDRFQSVCRKHFF